MNPEELRSFCLSFENTTEDFPFGPENLVFRIEGKIYLIIDLSEPDHCNVKCDPEKAIQFREEYPEDVLPGYHMNKKHWNTIRLNGKLPKSMIKDMIRESYQLVTASGPARPGKKRSVK
jgi:predicted DNA-binding protein (MmcQ/YjbR family)